MDPRSDDPDRPEDPPAGPSASEDHHPPAAQPHGAGAEPTAEEKRAALEELLQSAGLLRAEQLRRFLAYICEMELGGRGGELNEYLIGVEALGKPSSYSTSADPSVRRRAHQLRDKLQEVYATELKTAPVRIELPKGRYVPRFVSSPPAGEPVAPDASAATMNRLSRAHVSAWWLVPAALLGALAGTASLPWVRPSPRLRGIEPVVAEAWGPLAHAGASVTVCLASPAHYSILPYPQGPLPPGVKLLPHDEGLRAWYGRSWPMSPETQLGIHVAGPVRSGEVLGLVTAVRTLMEAGADFQVVVEGRVSMAAVRGRNLLLFGNPEYSFVTSALLEKGVWTVDYDPGRQARVIRPQKAFAAKRETYAPNSGWHRPYTFGLITSFPSEGAPSDNPTKTVIISCTHSSACQASIEYFASPAGLQALKERFRAEGQHGFPAAYQVVVKCRMSGAKLVSGEYEAHAVLPPS